MIYFDGIEIRPDKCLIGTKTAYQFGDKLIIVSPAMYDLIKHADEGELKFLLGQIKVKHLPPLPDLRNLQLPSTF